MNFYICKFMPKYSIAYSMCVLVSNNPSCPVPSACMLAQTTQKNWAEVLNSNMTNYVDISCEVVT